jgi:hypothetical protein
MLGVDAAPHSALRLGRDRSWLSGHVSAWNENKSDAAPRCPRPAWRLQKQLAKAANVAHATLADFETGNRRPYERTLIDIQGAMKAAGVLLIDENGEGPGVRL